MKKKQYDHKDYQLREQERTRDFRHRLDLEVKKIEFERKFQLKDHFNENHQEMNHRRGLGRKVSNPSKRRMY